MSYEDDIRHSLDGTKSDYEKLYDANKRIAELKEKLKTNNEYVARIVKHTNDIKTDAIREMVEYFKFHGRAPTLIGLLKYADNLEGKSDE
jgi:protease II